MSDLEEEADAIPSESFGGKNAKNSGEGLHLEREETDIVGSPSSSNFGQTSPRRRGIARLSTSEDDVLTHLEDDVVKEALKSGLDLREYSKQVEEKLKKVENEAVQDYIRQAEEIAGLHEEINSCDDVLQKMEMMLASFQADLGSISSEIKSLQEQSVEMNLKLKNRQAVRGELSQFVDDMVISPAMIQTISESPVTEREFLEQLHELQHKITFVKQQEFREAKAVGDVQPVVESLKLKAVAKIREFLLLKIGQFRKPLANYQVQQNNLLKFRFYYEFLLANEREIAREIRDEYVDTLSKAFFSYFKTYGNRLMRLQLEDVATKEDLLGAEDTTRSGGIFSSKPTVRNRATVFSMGNRNSVISTELEAPVIVPHAANQNNQKFHFEALFRSLQLALVEQACHEFLFVTDFFMATGQGALELFGQVMGKAISAITKCLDENIVSSYDAIALLLCIHLVYIYQATMQKRAVPALDQYWERMLGVLWHRFEYVMQLHVDSVRCADVTRLAATDTRPHYIIRRYAEFSSALVAVNVSAQDERLQAILGRLQAEVDQLLAKLASGLRTGGRKGQIIFLINNYDLVLSVLMEKVSEDSREANAVRELLQRQVDGYVEELLFPHFGALMNFVKECEPLAEQGHTELLQRYTEKVPNIVKSFGVEWKRAIESVNQEVMRSFTNFKNGTTILQTALTQLIQYYHKFQKVLSNKAFAQCSARNELVNIHHIMVEVKKYKPAF